MLEFYCSAQKGDNALVATKELLLIAGNLGFDAQNVAVEDVGIEKLGFF